MSIWWPRLSSQYDISTTDASVDVREESGMSCVGTGTASEGPSSCRPSPTTPGRVSVRDEQTIFGRTVHTQTVLSHTKGPEKAVEMFANCWAVPQVAGTEEVSLLALRPTLLKSCNLLHHSCRGGGVCGGGGGWRSTCAHVCVCVCVFEPRRELMAAASGRGTAAHQPV